MARGGLKKTLDHYLMMMVTVIGIKKKQRHKMLFLSQSLIILGQRTVSVVTLTFYLWTLKL